MTFEKFVFWSMAATAVLPALAVVLMRNTVHSALMLGVSLLGVAGLFARLGADFLFGGQILVYVGGVAVLIVFVVMLLGRASDLHLRQVNSQWAAALLVCAITAAGLWKIVALFPRTGSATLARPATTAPLGRLLLSDYALPFELVSLVLIAALLGAVHLSRQEKSR